MLMEDIMLIEEEQNRIKPYVCEGDMQAEIKSDMSRWAKDTGVWGSMHYSHMVEAFAEARGWTQESFSGMEIV